MSQRIAQFYKVSTEQYTNDMLACCNRDFYANEWAEHKLPARATEGSAGYDFFMPHPIELKANKWYVIPTGIRCEIDPGWVLAVFPKSGLGFKYQTVLANTVGIIDSDYFFSENEGHILLKMKSSHQLFIPYGKAFVQGLFLPYGITKDDAATGARNGGFGSTGV